MLSTPVLAAAVPLATVDRAGTVESVHLGTVAVLGDDGIRGHGDTDVPFLPRSALKPVQAVALLRAGLDLDGELLALSCASHSGEPAHVDGVRRILGDAGLAEDDLDNTPDLPLDPAAAAAVRVAGTGPQRILQNCSGKHAGMLAACVAAGWPITGYRDPGHPLQGLIRQTVAELTGVEPFAVTVDGCGAPLFGSTPAGLARAFAAIATAVPGTPEHRVARAMREHPWWVGGTGRPVTRLAEAVPGLVAKDGAEGVLAGALPDGRAFAITVLDGSPRPLPVVAGAVLERWGVPVADEVVRVDVLGYTDVIGAVRPLV